MNRLGSRTNQAEATFLNLRTKATTSATMLQNINTNKLEFNSNELFVGGKASTFSQYMLQSKIGSPTSLMYKLQQSCNCFNNHVTGH